MPLICAIAISYLLGAFAGAQSPLPPAVPAAASAAALAFALIPRIPAKTYYALMCAAAFLAASFSMQADIISYNRMPLRNYILNSAETGAAEAVTGIVKSTPTLSDGVMRFELDVKNIRTAPGVETPCPGRLMAILPAAGPGPLIKPPLYGDSVTVEGRLSGLDRLSPRVEPRYRSSGIAGFIRATPGLTLRNHGPSRTFPLLRWGAILREKTSDALRDAAGKQWFPIIGQMLFGAGDPIPDGLQRMFRSTGTIHVLVVSGQQVMLMLGAFIAMSFLWKRSVWGTIPIIGAALLIYYAMTGGGPSVTRALVMGMICLFCTGTGRTYSPLEALSWAAVILCAANPWNIYNAGAHLSFAACLGLTLIYPRISWLAPKRSHFRRPAQAFLLSISAQIPLFPLLAHYFGTISVISPIANIFIVPVAAVALPYGLITGALCAIWHGFIPVLGPPLRAMMWLMTALVKIFAAIPLGQAPSIQPGLLAILYFASITGAIWLIISIRNARREHFTPAIFLLGMPASLLAFSFLFTPPDRNMRVTFLDVGEGDSTLIEAPCRPGGRPVRILIDAGGSTHTSPGRTPYDPGERIIAPELRRRGIGMLDMLIISHPDADHLGGALWLLKNIPVAHTADTGFNPGTPLYRDYRALLKQQNIRTETGGEGLTVRVPGCMQLDFIYPPRELLPLGQKSTNEISQTLVLRFGDTRILFPGDIGPLGEQQLLTRRRRDLRADIIKIPHHGSATSSSRPFLRAVHPQTAIISAGRSNMYGHPSRSTLARLAYQNIRTYRTDISGNINITIPPHGKDITINPEFKQPTAQPRTTTH